MNRDPRIEIGSVVQLNGKASSPCYMACLLVVAEISSLGLLGYVMVPGEVGSWPKRIYLFPKWEAVEYIGEAVMTVET